MSLKMMTQTMKQAILLQTKFTIVLTVTECLCQPKLMPIISEMYMEVKVEVLFSNCLQTKLRRRRWRVTKMTQKRMNRWMMMN